MDLIDLGKMGAGILNEDCVRHLIEKGWIKNLDGADEGIDGSAFDLHLTNQIWRMKKGSVKNTTDGIYSDTVLRNDHYAEKIPWDDSTCITLEKNNTYVAKIREEFDLPKRRIHGRATTKSSIGRIDILTRLIANCSPVYDTVPEDYVGELHLEITPLAFNIKINTNIALHQLRLFHGKPELSKLTEQELQLYHGIILEPKDDGSSFEPKETKLHSLRVSLKKTTIKRLGDKNEAVAYVSKKGDNDTVDLTGGKQEQELFWDVEGEEKVNDELMKRIQCEQFYILRSRERLKLTENIAVYIYPVVEKVGEWRTHYAGLVHPSFGSTRDDGTPVIFEVRGHNLHVVLRDGEALAQMAFYRMLRPSRPEDQAYETQELSLSKVFE